MKSLIDSVNDGDRHAILVSVTGACRLKALLQSGFDRTKTKELKALTGMSLEALNRLIKLHDLFFDGFQPGQSVEVLGSVRCGACGFDIYMLPCIHCQDATWIKAITSLVARDKRLTLPDRPAEYESFDDPVDLAGPTDAELKQIAQEDDHEQD